MSMVVKNNMEAVRTLNILNFNSNNLQNSLAKVSSGMKINSAQDDASGYAISERMRVRIRALDQANQNAQNDSSLMKTAEGAVNNTIDLLRTLKEKAINAANDSNTDEDRLTIQKEIDQFIDQIDDNALTQFNGKYLVDGSKNYVNVAAGTTNKPYGTKSVFINQGISTSQTQQVELTALKDRAGTSLGIQTSDTYTISWVINGKNYSTSGDVGTLKLTNVIQAANTSTGSPFALNSTETETNGSFTNGTNKRVLDKYGQEVYTPDGQRSIYITTSTTSNAASNAQGGLVNQIAGVTISIMDQEGNVRKSANSALEFKLFQRAENTTEGGQKNMLNFQIGSEANQSIKVALEDMRSQALGLKGSAGDKLSVKTKEHANAAINVIENALTMALNQATTIGAIEARLEYTETNLTTSSENVQSAESTIRDADMAKEMTNYTKNNVLLQSAQAMLAQANQNSNAVLSLLQQ